MRKRTCPSDRAGDGLQSFLSAFGLEGFWKNGINRSHTIETFGGDLNLQVVDELCNGPGKTHQCAFAL